MGNTGELSPYEAQDAAGFVASMQRLKVRSGLTYRELEERAALSGDVLARSTLADVLQRSSLPRPEVVAAFVRACGQGHRVGDWLDARTRIASRIAAGTVTSSGSEDGAESPPDAAEAVGVRSRPTAFRTTGFVAAVMVPLFALIAWGLLLDNPDTPGKRVVPATGWVTIRPSRTPDLCLTDGRDRAGAYANAVAVQLPCVQATVPRTYLEPAGEDLYRIQWHHPQEGKGCLTVMSTGPVKGMLEPRNDCVHATLFHLVTAGTRNAGEYLIRPGNSSRCIGIVDEDTAEGAEAVEERCTGGAGQRFLVREG
ncbi:hypothetical protein GCM10011579_032560 [Streptomyces albiflavescens]|uniref:XRE family transcriptional regulator n=1 Tax=Streptomyces albiflavescens TaxID=1623582 RepID=A0A917Y2W6_9ACTN|nr:helix-turn-helix domain-containing protein [Streptomyces albiflavescens]GGN63821.1 hypothetical protein GCM10011579_032560 [Streptomyces albiflavescens]